MNYILTFCFLTFSCFCFADETKSVLINKNLEKSTCNVFYENVENIAPCSVSKTVDFCVKKVCCNCVETQHVFVEICVPRCPPKESVRFKRGKVVYDYGKYEVVVINDKNGDVRVNYRKRLFCL